MKKIILACAMLVGLGTSSVTAQDLNTGDKKLSFGVRAEANMSNHLLSDMDDYQSNLKIGASLGGFAKFDLHRNFAIQPEVLFHYKASELELKSTGAKQDFEYWGMEIPIYGLAQTQLWNGRGYVGLGPYVGFGFSSKLGGVDSYEEINGQKQMQRWDVGAGCMLGYEFNFGLQINAGYKIGFIDALDANKSNASMNNQTISLGLAYRF